MDATDPAPPVPCRRHACAGVLLLALWLGWTVPALWAQLAAADAGLMCTPAADAAADPY